MLTEQKRKALVAAGFDPDEIERMLSELSGDARDSGRERKEKSAAVVGGGSFLADVVTRIVNGTAFKGSHN